MKRIGLYLGILPIFSLFLIVLFQGKPVGWAIVLVVVGIIVLIDFSFALASLVARWVRRKGLLKRS
jgi:peptidoglycan/LPS O-acetylase OafA/YrhL